MKLRHLITLLLCLLLAAAMCVPALADVIFEPPDSFYQSNTKNCIYINRSYTANGKNGAVDIVKEPASADKVATINNGNVFYVSHTYKDKSGAEWGVVMFNPDGSGNLGKTDYSKAKNGWIKMADMKLVYDYISFAEDHKNEFKPYTGSYDALKSAGKVVFWTYPGSGVIAGTVESKNLDKNFAVNDTYTDKDGRVWGGISYYFGIRDAWICLSDPAGEKIAVSHRPRAALRRQLRPIRLRQRHPVGCRASRRTRHPL